jgi:hypothetical protein
VDRRLLETLRHVRDGSWTYSHGSSLHRDLLMTYSRDLGYPESWGDPTVLPARGGPSATETWRALGVSGRSGRGGVPCELVHGTVGTSLGLQASCTANIGIRAMTAFLEAFLIYLPVRLVNVIPMPC